MTESTPPKDVGIHTQKETDDLSVNGQADVAEKSDDTSGNVSNAMDEDAILEINYIYVDVIGQGERTMHKNGSLDGSFVASLDSQDEDEPVYLDVVGQGKRVMGVKCSIGEPVTPDNLLDIKALCVNHPPSHSLNGKVSELEDQRSSPCIKGQYLFIFKPEINITEDTHQGTLSMT